MPRNRLAVVALAATIAIAALASPAAAERPARAETYVVKFHADWCGSCKAMGPVMRDLGSKLDGEPVLFVELDLTDRKTTGQARLLASALGLSWLYKQNAPKTGFILVVDAKTKKVRARLTKRDSFKAMVAAVRGTRAGSTRGSR